MNYFTLFETPISMKIDAVALKKKYYQLSKLSHPDLFALEDAHLQQQAMQDSTIINQAYATLQDASLRLTYIFQQFNVIVPEEQFKLSSDFLMEMMELNEQIMDAKCSKDDTKLNNIHHQVQELELQLSNQILWLYKLDEIEGFTHAQQAQLQQYYYEKKYVQRVKALLADKEVEL
jgi:molecular chaperone HscB